MGNGNGRGGRLHRLGLKQQLGLVADHLFVEVRVVFLDGKGFLDSQLIFGGGMVHN